MTLTRRQLVLGAAIGLPALVASTDQWGARTLSRDTRKHADVSVLQTSDIRFFDRAFTSVSTYRVPTVLGIAQSGHRFPATTMTIDFDPRLLESTGPIVIGAGGRFTQLEALSTNDLGESHRRVTFRLPEATLPKIALLPLAVRSLYPNDGLDKVKDFSIAIQDASKSAVWSRSWALEMHEPARPWGAVLSAGWQDASSADGKAYWIPTTLRCESIGPNAIPSGAFISVDADDRYLSGGTISAANVAGSSTALNSKNETLDQATRLIVPIDRQIPAGQALTVSINPRLSYPTGEPSGIKIATASFLTGVGTGLDRFQRSTRAAVVSNLTSSGSSLAAQSELGKV